MSDLDYPAYGAWMPEDFPAPGRWDQVLNQPDYSFTHRPTSYQPWYPPVPPDPPAPDYGPGYAPGYPPVQGYPPPAPAGYWPPAPELLSPAPPRTAPPPRTGAPPRADPLAPAEPAPPAGRVLWWLPFGHRLVLLPKTPGQVSLTGHRDVNGGWLRPAVFGAMDGLVTNASLIAGVGGGGGGHGAIVLTGVAGLIAGAFSMATGEFISVQSQNELAEAEIELEKKQHRSHPGQKLDRLTEIYISKGVSPNLAEAVARQISADPRIAVETHLREDLGIDPDDLPSPRTAAVASFAAFTVGALLPLSPFLVGIPNLLAALIIAALSAVAGGAAVARLTGRPMVSGGLRQFAAAFLATGMAFVIGHLIGGHLT